ncbi:MAG TPA: tetratricopeptide repeat protein [Steroidobacteraceae bacterium]|nr:tetratricopeptide repeat protein [Steroidobacteraceae bacterium]
MNRFHSFAVGLAIALPLFAAGCTGTEDRKARYLERGQDFLAQGNLDKARVEFSNALQIDPTDAQARYLAGRVAEKQIKPRDAVANYQAAIDADPEFIAARGALGRLYLLGGLPEKAREIVAPALLVAPEDAQLRTVRGGLRALDGDLAGALEDGEAAVKAAPDDEVALAFLAAQYRRQNRTEDAITTLQEGLERIPDSADLRVILAELLYDSGRKAEAIAQLETVATAHSAVLAHWQRLARVQLLDQNPEGAEQALRQAVAANPDSTDAKSALVVLLAAQKDQAAALAEMRKFIAADPKNAELKIAQGQFLESARQPDQAAALYREVIKSEGTDAQGLVARNRLAVQLVQKGDLPAAEALLAEVLAENPRDNDALILRAGIAMSRGETSAAITDLRAVLRDQPDAAPIMRALARAHQQDGDTELAEEALRSAAAANPLDVQSRFELASLLAASDRGSQALPVLEQLIKDAPDNVAAREAYFRVQAATGDLAGARRTAEELTVLQPDLPAGAMLLGALYEHDRKLGDAVREYDHALRVSSDPIPALTALVRVYLGQKQAAKAAERIQAVIDRAPQLAAAHNLLGEVRMASGDHAAALKAFDAAIGIQPSTWVPWRGKALTQVRLKQMDQAAATLADGIAKAGALELYVDLAAVQEQRGGIDDSIATYEDALKRHPQSLTAANNLAMLLVTYRKDQAGLDRAAQLAELLDGSERPALIDTRGWVKLQRGSVSEALPLLEEAAEKAPGSPVIRYHLGMAQLKSGDRAAAKQSLQAALAAGPGFAGAEEARAALASLENAGG